MKIHAKRYGNEGHNITTSEELKTALESYDGIQDTFVYTAEVDFKQQILKKMFYSWHKHVLKKNFNLKMEE